MSGRLQPRSILELMKEVATRPPDTSDEPPLDDDCPLCRMLAETADQYDIETVTLPSGFTYQLRTPRRS